MPTLDESKWSSRDSATIIALLAAPFIVFHRFISSKTTFAVGDGIVDLPYRVLTARKVLGGDWSFWTPDIMCGHDIWTYPVSAVLHPFTYLIGVFSPLLWLNVFNILCFSIALCGTYIFARLIGVGRLAAVFSAVSYAFSGFFISYFTVMIHGMGYVAAFAPFLWSAIYYLTRKPSPRRAALVAIAVYLLGSGGQEQIFIYSMFVGGFVMLFGCFSEGVEDRRRVVFWSALAVILGGLSLSGRFIPSILVMDSEGREIIAGNLATMTRTNAPSRFLDTLFVPPDRQAMQIAYLGFAPVLLAIYGATYIRKSRAVLWSLAGLALAAVGMYSFCIVPENVQSRIPVLKWFHSPFRHMFEAFFWCSILAGVGADRILKKGASLLRLILCAVIITPMIIKAGHAYWIAPDSIVPLVIPLSALLIGALVFPKMKSRAGFVFAIVLALLLMMDKRYLEYNFDYYKDQAGEVDVGRVPAMAEFIKSDPGRRSGRFVFIGNAFDCDLRKTTESVAPNKSLLFGVPTILAKNEMLGKRLNDMLFSGARAGIFRIQHIKGVSPILDILDTRYIVSQKARQVQVGGDIESAIRVVTKNYADLYYLVLGLNTSVDLKIDLDVSDRIEILFRDSIPRSRKPDSRIEVSVTNENAETTKCAISIGDGGGLSSSGADCILENHKDDIIYSFSIPAPSGAGSVNARISNNLYQEGFKIVKVLRMNRDGKVVSEIPIVDIYIRDNLGAERVFSNEYVDLYNRKTAFGAQWLADSILIEKPDTILRYLRMAAMRPDIAKRMKTVAMVEDMSLLDEAKLMANTAPDKLATIERTVDRPDFIEARVSSKTPVFAVFSEKWAKGWTATLDGAPVPIYMTDYYIRGIYAPAGDHVIQMRYRTPGLRLGLALTALSLATITFMSVFGAGKNQKETVRT